MNTRQLFCFVVVSLVCSASSRGQPKEEKRLRRPHVVFVLADDLGYNDIGYHARNYGSQMYTPFLDSLAARGVKLENYYVQPICSPTRGQLLTGRYQIHTGLVHGVIKATQAYGLPLDNTLLPRQLQNCGYKTHMIGKWHLGYFRDEYLPWKRGFHTFYGFLTGGENYYNRYKCEPKKSRQFCGIDFVDSKIGATNKTWGAYSTHLYLRKAKKIIKNHPKHKPLFLYLAFQAVHAPLQVPRRYQKPFRHIENRNRRLYGGVLFAMDKTLKRLAQFMKKANMWKDTIFIFSTDNGGQTKRGGNNWPLRGSKGTLWEGGIKGVGFVHGKPLKLSSLNITNSQLIHVSDWFPTIMSAAKCKIMNGTQSLDGYNQWETITRNSPSKRTEILHNIDPLFKKATPPEIRAGFDVSVRAGIRSGSWKLLTGKPDYGIDGWIPPPECMNCAYETDDLENQQLVNTTSNIKLFNIVADPYERNEVSSLYPEVVDLLLSRLVEYNSSAVLPIYPPHNRYSDPNLRGGFWLPWNNKRLGWSSRQNKKTNKSFKRKRLNNHAKYRHQRRQWKAFLMRSQRRNKRLHF